MAQTANTTTRKSRRFPPEPIETSSRSSRKRIDDQTASQPTYYPTQRPQPQSTNIHPGQVDRPTGRTGFNDVNGYTTSDVLHVALSPPRVAVDQQRSTRKFTPQLMETARHSYRPRKKHNSHAELEDTQAPIPSNADTTVIQESRFSYSNLLRRQENRRHSFRVPDLPAIPSSGSEDSIEQGPNPTSKQPITSQQAHLLDYILPFPSHPSKKQLEDRALAAFPNEQIYQPVDHFAIDKDEDEPPNEEELQSCDPRPGIRLNRRASSADLSSELEYLRRHKEEAGMNRRHYLTTRGGRLSLLNRRIINRSLDTASKHGQLWDLNRALAQSQAISPPMLGGDLIFPQSGTPETTLCEGNHTTSVADEPPASSPFFGLWSVSPRSSVQYDDIGLWNGTCKLGSHSKHVTGYTLPGLVTPRHGLEANCQEPEPEYSPEQNTYCAAQSSRQNSTQDDCTDEELNDNFVTQIYNYLSLGYPSLARYYDYELSKVSGISVATLRADDLYADAKGYVGVHDNTTSSPGDGVCTRWTALQLYIKEWRRQRPCMIEIDPFHDTWGVRERKGSWAL
ncbi:hypothetical protein BJX70DRAFT_342034 [Aspergillus crustosus]